MTQIQEFTDAIREYGASPADTSEFIADDTIRRAHDTADKPRKTSISYQLKVDADGFACGWFICYKISDETQTWHSKAPKGKVRDYATRARQARESEDNKLKREKHRNEQREAALRDINEFIAASESADGHPYLARKGVSWPALRQCEGMLLVPITSAGGELIGCQQIYGNGFKHFIAGGDWKGGYYLISDPDDDFSRVFVAEGLSTALSVRDVSGSPVYVAFNSGNLKSIATLARDRHQRATVIIAADNDLWTKKPNGEPYNAGMRHAEQAAVGVGAVVWSPEGLEYPHTDWNDAVAVMGRDWVVADLAQIPMHIEEPEQPQTHEHDYSERSPHEALSEMVNPLGYEGEVYYFLPRNKGQIAAFAAPGLSSPANLFQMGTPDQYRAIVGDYDMKHSDIASTFMPILITMGNDKGVYNPDRVYGAGVWREGKRVVVNTGSDVYLPDTGERIKHSEVKLNGVMIKESQSYSLDAKPLANKEAHKLMTICNSLTWAKSINGTLLAGWMVIAPVAGALRWRSHVFITGQKGAGKSTVIERIVGPILGDTGIRMDGGSTEAGLRKLVKNSSRPVIMDEFEAENKRDQETVARILTWARKASSGGTISNANATYRAQSSICFAAINPMIVQGADADRITLLELAINKGADSESDYNRLLDLIYDTITPEYSDGLIRRTVDNMGALLANCETFSKYASRILKSKRSGDQVGPMLAGAYMLHSTRKVTDAVAEEWCSKQDWQWAEESNEGTDSEKLMRRILNSLIDYTTHDRTQKIPVSELISRVRAGGLDVRDCRSALGRIGIRVEGDDLWISNSDDQLSRLLEGTPWVSYRNSMLRYPGALSSGKAARFGAGSPSRYMSLPLAGLIEGMEAEEIIEW